MAALFVGATDEHDIWSQQQLDTFFLDDYGSPCPLFDDCSTKEEQEELHRKQQCYIEHAPSSVSEHLDFSACNISNNVIDEDDSLPSLWRPYNPNIHNVTSLDPWSVPSSSSSGRLSFRSMWKRTTELHMDEYEKKRPRFAPKLEQGPIFAGQEREKSSDNHKIAEQKRRRRERDHLNTLRRLVPFLKKTDKVSTLKGTIQFIQKLQHEKKILEAKSLVLAVDDDEVSKSSSRSNLTQDQFSISNPDKMQLKINSGKSPVFLTKLASFLDDFGLDMDAMQGNVPIFHVTVHCKVDKSPVYSEEQLQKAVDERFDNHNAYSGDSKSFQ